jgi:hypothetical protein
MTQAHIVRRFAADPAGVALLLSGPVADTLWPAASPTGGAEGLPLVEVGPPMRAGVGFVVDLRVDDPALGAARGRLTLVPETAELPVTATSARLVLTSLYGAADELRSRAEHFLEALGSMAVARSTAA